MRNAKGQFIKGQHWRPRQPYWDHDWLYAEYVTRGRSAVEIGADFGITENGVLYWLKKHGIPTRSMQEVRTAKHWGLSGEKNGMFGKTGEQNPHWRGGCTPERQGLYCSEEWAKACVEVWKRDKATCQRCGASSQDTVFHIHHIVPFSIKELRTEPANLVLLCAECHWFVHSRENLAGEFIGG